jgi:hypothetical protein
VLPLMGNQSQPPLLFVFIIERPVSALQSHHRGLHKHEMDNSTWVEGEGLLLVQYRKRLYNRKNVCIKSVKK